MKKFELFQENSSSKIQILVLAGIVLICVMNILTLKNSTTWILSDGRTSLKPSKSDFCLHFGTQLVSKRVSDKIVAEDIFSSISNNKYSAFEFDGSERVFGVFENEAGCEVSIKDTLGIRVFKIGIRDNKRWPSIGFELFSIYEGKGE